jgi:hypothetical protein
MHYKSEGAIGLVLVLGGLIVFAVWKGQAGGVMAPPEATGLGSADSLQGVPGPLDLGGSDKRRSGADSTRPTQHGASTDGLSLQGVVRSYTSGGPLPATLVWGDKRIRAWSTDGSFRLKHGSPREPVLVSHPGYHDQLLGPFSEDQFKLVIRLVPEVAGTLLVVDEQGVPQAGVEVLGIRRATRRARFHHRAWSRVVGVTNDQGKLSVGGNQGDLLFAHKAGRTSRVLAVEGLSRENLTLVLPHQRATVLGIRSLGGDPIAGANLVLKSLGKPVLATLEFETIMEGARAGQCDALLPLGDYLLIDWQRSLAPVFPEEPPQPRLARSGLGPRGYSVSVTVAADAALTWVDVEVSQAPCILAVDDRGQPRYPFQVWSEVLVPNDAGLPTWMPLASRLTLRSGSMSLAAFEPGRFSDGSFRLAIGADGCSTSHLGEYPTASGQEPVRVVLRRDSDQRYLRLLTEAGAPFTGRARLVASNSKRVLWDEVLDPSSGLAGPFLFSGAEPVEVLKDVGAGVMALGRVGPEQFAGGAVPILHIDGSCTLELLTGGRRVPGLYAVNDLKQRFSPQREGDRLVFRSLPPGRFTLLTPEGLAEFQQKMIDGTLGFGGSRPGDIFELQLRGGEHRIMPLPARFTPGTAVGRVRIPPGLTTALYLYPIGDGRSVPQAREPHDARLPLGADGEYSLEDWVPLPQRLAVVRVDAYGRYINLGSFAPGESYELRGGPLQVNTPGLESACVQATVRSLNGGGFAVVCAKRSERLLLGWFPEGRVDVRIVDPQEREHQTAAVILHGSGGAVEVDASEVARSSWASAEVDPFFR